MKSKLVKGIMLALFLACVFASSLSLKVLGQDVGVVNINILAQHQTEGD